MSELLQEYVDSGHQQLRVDRTAGVIRGVKLLGLRSKNGRRYQESALAEAVSLYEGAKVNINHPKGHPLSPRDYQDRLGVISAVEFRPQQGLFGDLHFNPKHILSEQLMWDAEHASQNVGLSHNVLARTTRQGDATVVEAITKVQSIDLVADPATTLGLFEQDTPAIAWDQLTISELELHRPDLLRELREAQAAQLEQVRSQARGVRTVRSPFARNQLMTMELNIANDFAAIIDLTEAVILQRRFSAESVAIPKAWRYSDMTQQADAGMPGVAQSDAVWQFAWPGETDLPRVGDAVIDTANECWTILSIEERGAKTRLRCNTRNLQVVHQLVDRIEIQAAVWEDSGSGPEIIGWTTLRAAVPARIQPEQTTLDNTADPPTSTATYRVMLADDTPLDHNHRIVGPDGAIYQILEYAQAKRIDTLPIAKVERLVTT